MSVCRTSAFDLSALLGFLFAAAAWLRVHTLPPIDNPATFEPSSHCR